MPIFVVDRGGGDIAIYLAVEDAENHLEAIDVKNEEYKAYDADGRSLTLEIDDGRVRLRLAEEASHSRELENHLRCFLAKVEKLDPSDLGTGLTGLAKRATKFAHKPPRSLFEMLMKGLGKRDKGRE